MKYALALMAVAGIAASANAQTTSLSFKASVNGGSFSSGPISAANGDFIVIEAYVSLTAPGVAFGFGGMNWNPTVAGWTGADLLASFTPQAGRSGVDPGEFGRVKFMGAVATSSNPFPLATSLAGPTLQINGSNSNRVAQSQTPPSLAGTNFVAGTTDVLIFRMGFGLSGATAARSLVISALPDATPGRWYTSATSTTGTPINAAVVPIPLSVNVPTPGALALLGLGGLVAGRRRR
jgi:uncharacterized protein (TIGR03382 family)